MTSVSSSAASLQTLMSLYESENKSSGGSAKLTTDQVSTLEGMIQGDSSSSSSGISTLLGNASGTSPEAMGSILDQITSKIAASASSDSTSTTSDSTSSSSATSPQQKAASLMQSVYQSQQQNLFTLIG